MSARRPSPQGSARGADAARSFVEARDFLLAQRTDYATAYAAFRWPRPEQFNWALDYFEPLAHGNPRTALWIVDEGGEETRLTFHELNERSNRVASFLRQQGVRRGSRLLLMLPNVAALWEVTLAAMKLGAVVSPATLLLSPADIADRIERGGLSHVVADAGCVDKFVDMPGVYRRIAVGRPVAGWEPYAAAAQATAEPMADGRTLSSDPLLLYFTSGTTARPKIVLHTHASYAIGHLSTMYWIGLRAGDLHLNISSPGWAKHAWSSFFAPWNAGATVFMAIVSYFPLVIWAGAAVLGWLAGDLIATDPVVIDGFSQPGASANTGGAGQADNAIRLIEINGITAPSGFPNGLHITGGGSIFGERQIFFMDLPGGTTDADIRTV